MTLLTTTRTDDGNTTTWAVHTDTRATTLTVARGTPDQVTRMVEMVPSAAGFCDETTAAVLSGVYAIDGDDRDAYLGSIARPLFHAAARAGFDDAAVWALLAELHAKAV